MLKKIGISILTIFLLLSMLGVGLALAAPVAQEAAGDDDWVDWFEVAAEAIGVDADTLFDELDEDKSIADVAQEQDVDPQTVIDAIVTAETEWVNELVSEGDLSQEEADEWLAELPEEARLFVEEPGLDEFFEGIDWFEVAAEAIGVDVDTLFDELDEDKSIADVAQEQDVDPQTVIDAIVAAETEWVNELVSEGDLSQEEAGEWLAELPEEARMFVEEPGFDEFFEGIDWFEVAAEAIGVDVDTLFDELDEDKSIADVAQEQDVDPQTVIDAIVTAETEWVNEQVSEGSISQEEADEWLAELPEEARLFVEEPGFDECEE